jgi:DNA gyrase subunit B
MELNPEQLWEVAMNPETRNLTKVELSDLESTLDLFEELMGKKSTDSRKDFIVDHAENANVDI